MKLKLSKVRLAHPRCTKALGQGAHDCNLPRRQFHEDRALRVYGHASSIVRLYLGTVVVKQNANVSNANMLIMTM